MLKLKRVFFAIPLATDEQKLIQQAVTPLITSMSADVRWLHPENWHITMRFLGGVDQSVIDYMIQVAETAVKKLEKFTLTGIEIAGFPAEKSRMVAVYIKPNPILENLFQQLDEAAVQSGLNREDRSFKPHITLAKARHRIKSFDPIIFDKLHILIQELVLYESQPTKVGSHYIPLKKFTFT